MKMTASMKPALLKRLRSAAKTLAAFKGDTPYVYVSLGSGAAKVRILLDLGAAYRVTVYAGTTREPNKPYVIENAELILDGTEFRAWVTRDARPEKIAALEGRTQIGTPTAAKDVTPKDAPS